MNDIGDNDSNLTQALERALAEKQPNSKAQSNTEKESLAQKAGYIPEIAEIEVDEGDLLEPADLSTKGNFWDRCGTKTMVIVGIVSLGVMTFAVIGKTFTTAMNSNQKEPQKILEQSKKVEEEEDIGALKTNNALGSQKAELQKLNSLTVAAAPTPALTTTPTPTAPTSEQTPPKPTFESKTALTSPKPVQPSPVKIQSTPVYTYQPVGTNPSPPSIAARSTVPAVKPQRQQQIIPPLEKVKTARLPTQTQTQPKPQVESEKRQSEPQPQITTQRNFSQPSDSTIPDPNTAWQAAASVGTYIASNESVEDTNKSTSKTEGQKSAVTPDSPKSQTVDNNGQSLIVGTHALGQLQTPIVWSQAGGNSQNQSYLIKLTESLKNADGTIAIPKEALVVIRVKSVAEVGWLDMSAVSIVINTKGGIIEKPIPEGAILVQASNGSPLRGEYRVEKVVEKPYLGSISDIELTADSSSSRWKVLAQALQQNSQQANKQKDKQGTPEIRLFTLNKGSSVQIYVNRSFSL